MVSGWAENVPTELKTLIWEKIASLDPLVMSSILTRLEVDKYDKQKASGFEKLDGAQSMEEILLEKWGTTEQKERLGKEEDVITQDGKKQKMLTIGKFRALRDEIRGLNEELEKKQKQLKDMEHPHAAKTLKDEAKLAELKKDKLEYLPLKDQIKDISQKYDQKKIEYGQADEMIRNC
jgi:hypothetical protein